MCETQCDMLSVAHLCNWQVHPCCHLNCSTLASQTGRLLEDETVTVWYAAFINDELIWDELAGGFCSFRFPNISKNKLSRRDKGLRAGSNGAFLFLSIFRMICSLPLQHHYWEGRQPPLRVAWVHECAFTRHVNNWRQLLHLEQTGNVGGLWGKVSQHDLNRSFSALCHFLQQNILDPLLFLSAFISSAEKCFVRGDFDWGWQLDLVAQILLRLLFVTVSHWQMYSVPFNVSEESCSCAMTIFFLFCPSFFVCLLFIALSWGKSFEISCQLGVNFLCSVIAAILKPCVYSLIPFILLFLKVIFNLDWIWI